MSEIFLFGLLLIIAYFIAHHAVMYLEKRAGGVLGIWRTVWFFLIFLVLLMGAQWLTRALLIGEGT